MFLHNCANVVWSLKGPKGSFSFCLGYFSLTKKFNHIAKVASILHLKSGDSCRPNYFLTSTPLGHISHLHTWLIASDWFLYEKIWSTSYKRSIFDMDKFWHLVWVNLTSCKFSLFFFLIFLYIFLIFDVFINKVCKVAQ